MSSSPPTGHEKMPQQTPDLLFDDSAEASTKVCHRQHHIFIFEGRPETNCLRLMFTN